jgi:hypothetical protein
MFADFVMAVAMRRATAFAVAPNLRGSIADGACGQVIKMEAGNSSGSKSSTRSLSVGVTLPLANVVVLLMGLDSSAVGIKALSWCYQHRSGPLRRIPSNLKGYARERRP